MRLSVSFGANIAVRVRNSKTTETMMKNVTSICTASLSVSGREGTRHEPPGVRVGAVGVAKVNLLNKLFGGVRATVLFVCRENHFNGDANCVCMSGDPNDLLFFGEVNEGLLF
jgi:hypothetical protein